MSGKPEDISNIAKAILAGDDSKKYVSELAKLTAKQIYAQGYQAGEAADKKEVWNAAIEEMLAKLNKLTSNDISDESYYWIEDEIRSLKK